MQLKLIINIREYTLCKLFFNLHHKSSVQKCYPCIYSHTWRLSENPLYIHEDLTAKFIRKLTRLRSIKVVFKSCPWDNIDHWLPKKWKMQEQPLLKSFYCDQFIINHELAGPHPGRLPRPDQRDTLYPCHELFKALITTPANIENAHFGSFHQEKESMALLEDLKKCSNLKSLGFHYCRLRDPSILWKAFEHWEQLQSFDSTGGVAGPMVDIDFPVSYPSMVPYMISGIAASCPNLRILKLPHHNNTSFPNMETFEFHHMDYPLQLERLEIAGSLQSDSIVFYSQLFQRSVIKSVKSAKVNLWFEEDEVTTSTFQI